MRKLLLSMEGFRERLRMVNSCDIVNLTFVPSNPKNSHTEGEMKITLICRHRRVGTIMITHTISYKRLRLLTVDINDILLRAVAKAIRRNRYAQNKES